MISDSLHPGLLAPPVATAPHMQQMKQSCRYDDTVSHFYFGNLALILHRKFQPLVFESKACHAFILAFDTTQIRLGLCWHRHRIRSTIYKARAANVYGPLPHLLGAGCWVLTKTLQTNSILI